MSSPLSWPLSSSTRRSTFFFSTSESLSAGVMATRAFG